jgi:regulator of RNase E activity RraB
VQVSNPLFTPEVNNGRERRFSSRAMHPGPRGERVIACRERARATWRTAIMSEERAGAWEVYQTQLDEEGHPAAILVDVSLGEPDPTRGHLVFPHREESQVLYALEDALTPALAKAGARLVGRVTTQGIRDFVYYAPGPVSEDRVRDVLAEWPVYSFDFSQGEDAEWDFYREVLAPSPREWQSIMTWKVIHDLSEHGDVLETPREVDHHVELPTPVAVETFLSGLEGFTCAGRDAHEEGEGVTVHLTRVHSVDFETVEGIVHGLLDNAEQVAGSYEGWGCAVMKSTDPGEPESEG